MQAYQAPNIRCNVGAPRRHMVLLFIHPGYSKNREVSGVGVRVEKIGHKEKLGGSQVLPTRGMKN